MDEPEEVDLEDSLRNLLYTNLITCLESYLSSAFINKVISDERHIRKFFETFSDFKQMKFDYSQLFTLKDKIYEIAKDEMLKIIYHNLPKVAHIYRTTLNVSIPKSELLLRAIVKRHDIVHRNGKTKNGNDLVISNEEIEELNKEIYSFVQNIETEFTNRNLAAQFPTKYGE